MQYSSEETANNDTDCRKVSNAIVHQLRRGFWECCRTTTDIQQEVLRFYYYTSRRHAPTAFLFRASPVSSRFSRLPSNSIEGVATYYIELKCSKQEVGKMLSKALKVRRNANLTLLRRTIERAFTALVHARGRNHRVDAAARLDGAQLHLHVTGAVDASRSHGIHRPAPCICTHGEFGPAVISLNFPLPIYG